MRESFDEVVSECDERLIFGGVKEEAGKVKLGRVEMISEGVEE